MEDFRARYRSPEVLILDDIQFICGKDKSEESLFHTCNALLREGKQLVLASDCAPDDLPFIHRRLISRLQAGLTVDLGTPDYSARLAILGFKATLAPTEIPEEVLHYLAARLTPNVRQLEGDLTKVVALSTLLAQPLTLDLAISALAPSTSASPRRVLAPTVLLRATAAYFHISPDALIGKSRVRTITHARQIAMHLIRTHTPTSLEQIGRLIGRRDHTTVIHGVQRISALLSTDPSIAETEAAILTIASSPLHTN
jgi:chromosomal replication initiator protein